MLSLIWKEWHEQAWKLAFCSIVLGALAAIGLHARIVPDETMIMWVCFIGGTLLPVLASASLVPAERGEGSMDFLLGLPVSGNWVLSAKVLIGLVLCVGPLIIAGLVSLGMASGREMYAIDIVGLYMRAIFMSVALFIWMLALTIRLPNESRAGVVGVGVVIFWLLATLGLLGLARLAVAISPIGFLSAKTWVYLSASSSGPSVVVVLGVQIVFAFALWVFLLRRFNAESEGTS